MSDRGVFDAYGAYYDLLYRNKDYRGEASYVLELIGDRSELRILELGCGTGGHAEHLARAGHHVRGIDFSAAMLTRAEARRQGLPADVRDRLEFSEANARSYRDGATYDVVLSLFHVFSYQITDQHLRQVFATAAAHLGPQGLLVFDYWHGPGVERDRPTKRVRKMADESCRVTRRAAPEQRPAEHRVDVRYQITVEDRVTGVTEDFEEVHAMRYLFPPELPELAGAAFGGHRHYAWMTTHPPTPNDWLAVTVSERV